MIEIFIGEDTQTARKALRKALEKEVGVESIPSAQRFSDVGFDLTAANEALFSQNLFGQQNIIILDGILDAPGGSELYTEELIHSPNRIMIRETAPTKEMLKLFKHIGEVFEFPIIKKVKHETNFAIADAIAARDKKAAWVEYVRAMERGSVAEEIHGTIFWATKLLYLCAHNDKEEAIKSGVNPYNYQKYLTYSKKFLDTELVDKLGELKDMYHAAHRGEGDFDTLLEQYILKA